MARSNRRGHLTIEEARKLADKLETMAETIKEAQQLAGRFSDAGPHRVIEMWETGRVIEDPKRPRSRNGQRLSKFEVQALGERWCELFGCLPPAMGTSAAPAAPVAPPAPEPADDTMLRVREVLRLTSLSLSTLKRHVADGTFPTPVKLSQRRNGWNAGAVKAWLAEREAASD